MNGNPEIKRQTELFLCGKLKDALPNYLFVPAKGGGSTGDATELIPPFAVVATSSAEKTLAQESTWLVTGTVQIVTHVDDTKSPDHAALVRAVYAALGSVAAAVYGPKDLRFPDFSFHGIDVAGMREAQDADLSAHADIIDFTCGVGG